VARTTGVIAELIASLVLAALLVRTFTHGPLLPTFSASRPLVITTAVTALCGFGMSGGLAARFLVGVRDRSALLTIAGLCAVAAAVPISFWAIFANLQFNLG
jgi:hypothetical protein